MGLRLGAKSGGLGFPLGPLGSGAIRRDAIVLPITASLGGFYSVVRLSTWNGQCLRVRRSSDNTELDIGFKNNVVDKAAADAFAAGSSLTISKWYDQSGNGQDIAQATQANQPSFGGPGEFRGIRGISIDGVSTSTTTQKWLQGLVTADRSALTVYQFLSPSSYGNDVQYSFTDATFATEFAKAYTNAAPFGVNYGTAVNTLLIGRTSPGMVNVSTSGTTGIIARHHGTEFTNATNATAQALGGLVIGKSLAGSTFNGDHNLWAFGFYNASHTSANMQAIEGVVNAAFQPATTFTKRLIYGGSSLITGSFATLLRNPAYWGGFAYSSEWELFQTAVHGRTLASEFSLRGDFDTLKDATKSKVVMVIDAPHNDIAVASYGSQAAAITAGQLLYTGTTVPFQSNLKTNSIIPIVPTIIDDPSFQRNTGNFRGDAMDAYNAAVRAGGVTNSHAVSDRVADSRLANGNDSTYFQPDHVHLTNLGYSILAAIDRAAILAA